MAMLDAISVPLSQLPLDHDMVQRMEAKGIHTTENLFGLGVGVAYLKQHIKIAHHLNLGVGGL